MAFNFSPRVVYDNSLITYIDTGNNRSYTSGKSTWDDLTTSKNNVTPTGNTAYNTENNGNFVLDGAGDYLYLNTTSNLPSGTCTILCWCNPDDTIASGETYTGLVSWGSRTNASPSNGILLSVSTASSPNVYVSSAYWYNDYAPNDLPLIKSNWNMVGVIARQGAILNNTTLICGNSNGLIFSTGTSTQYTRTLNFTNANLRIGCTDSNGTRAFKGKIAVVMIYNRELSTEEISKNYNALKSRFGIT
jgi:hypothetical protein